MTQAGFLYPKQGSSSFVGFEGGRGCPFSWEHLIAWSNVFLRGGQSTEERRLRAAMLPLEDLCPWHQDPQGVMLALVEPVG